MCGDDRTHLLRNTENGIEGVANVHPVMMPHPGRRTRKVPRLSKALLFCAISILSFIIAIPLQPATATTPLPNNTPNNPLLDSQSPQTVGADAVPDLSLPKPIKSSIDRLVGAGGVLEASPDNITIYNLGVRMRLLNGVAPHDELLGRDMRVLSSWNYWRIEAQAGNTSLWIQLTPLSSSFTVLGTNQTGTYVVRTMTVNSGIYAGTLTIVYHATVTGGLKWTLQFASQALGHYRMVYDCPTASAILSSPPSNRQITAVYPSDNFTFSWNDVPTSFNSTENLSDDEFSLTLDLGTLRIGSAIAIDPEIMDSTPSSATAYTFQRKVFFEPKGGYYFVFYYDGGRVVYAYSQNGTSWVNEQLMPTGWPAYTDDPASEPTVYASGQTVIVVAGQTVQATFNCPSPPQACGVATAILSYVVGKISGPNIAWQSVTTGAAVSRGCYSTVSTCGATAAIRYVSITLSSTGQPAFSFNFYGDSPTSGGAIVTDTGSGACADYFPENDVAVAYQGVWFIECETNNQPLRSVVLPADSQGNIRVIYQSWVGHYELKSAVITRQIRSSVGIIPSADTWISRVLPDVNMATDPSDKYELCLLAPTTGTTQENDVLIKFDPGLPSGVLVTKALLNITANGWNNGGWGTDNVNIYAPTAAWSESTTTFNTFWNCIPCLAPFSQSRVTNVNFASYTKDKILSLDVTTPVAMEAQGQVSNNGLFIGLDQNNDVNNIPADYFYSTRNGNIGLDPTLSITYECCVNSRQIVEAKQDGSDRFSAVAEADCGVDIVYSGGTDGNTTYARLAAGASSWTYSKNICSLCISYPSYGCHDSYPTLTIDSSTRDLYASAVETPGQGTSPSVIMKRKSPLQNWTDVASTTIASNPSNTVTYLGSNLVSTSGTNASWVSLVWTEQDLSGLVGVWFESLPIQTVWSPFASPSDPWDENGIVPYGQYFQNLGEYVSTSDGMLTIKQTYLSIPGRGLDLVLSGVYTEPQSFLNGSPYYYESYPWAPLGNGWQLDFPWMTNSPTPTFLHLQDGQGYRIPYSFWTGTTSTFENHQGENFRLVRNSLSYVTLYDRSGTAYSFDPGHRLTNITDPNGNTISFNYSGNQISCIADTVSRAFTLTYSNGYVSTISQVTGTCSNPGSRIRTVTFQKAGGSLSTYTDPKGRVTTYTYDTPNPWIVSRITYPTGWYSNYTYYTSSPGGATKSYRVSKQFTGFGSPPTRVRELDYAYTTGLGEQANNVTVTIYNGTSTQPVSFTSYRFSFAGVTWNVTDGTHVFIGGRLQQFGIGGEVVNDTVLVSDGQGHLAGSYTNHYGYDSWGNMIYSRQAINPSTNSYHESFNSYYNDGVQPGFNAFQESFRQANFTLPDNSWSVYGGTWTVNGRGYNGTSVIGSGQNSWYTYAWTTILKTDLSLQARVLIGSQVSTPPFVGVIGHYAGSYPHMWSLVLWNQSQGQNLVLQVVATGAGTSTPCLIQPGHWYTFNMTFHGPQATGWAQADGQSACHTISYNFSSSVSLSGTGFGLYAGGYSTIFSNVTVVTVSPSISGTGFSNSFYQAQRPGSSIHGAPAGTAELQNGNSSIPVETYYSYTPSGGLNQTRRLYAPGWVTISGKYDNYGNLKTLTDARGNTTNYAYSSTYQSAYLTSQTTILKPGSTNITRLYAYDPATGALKSTVDPNGYNTTYQYDILARPTMITGANGCCESYVYNDQANYVNVTVGNTGLTKQIYDGLGRLASAQRVLNGVVYSKVYTYDWE